MNPFEMVVLIVAIVMIAKVMAARHQRAPDAALDAENRRLHDEVSELKERVKVLERIATDSSSTLERQIEELRDRPNA